MKTIYVIDILGKHCGMDYYDNALCDNLTNAGYKTIVISNFSNEEGALPFYKNIFKIPKLEGILLFAYYFIKTAVFIFTHKNAAFIYLSYGEKYDQLLLKLSYFANHFFVDVHEVHALKYLDTSSYAKRFLSFYRKYDKTIIYHSERTKDILANAGYKGNRIYVPHFKYSIDTVYKEDAIDKSLRDIFDTNKINFLFFGNIRRIKGIDVVIDIFNNLSDEMKEKVILVIAGMNVENIEINLNHKNFKLIERHISDNELKFLYSNTNYVLLPYKKSSQSGILEMAIKFRKPMILSDIPYFKQEYEKCPSFGYISSIDNMGNVIKSIISTCDTKKFYTQEDLGKDSKKEDFSKFQDEFAKLF